MYEITLYDSTTVTAQGSLEFEDDTYYFKKDNEITFAIPYDRVKFISKKVI